MGEDLLDSQLLSAMRAVPFKVNEGAQQMRIVCHLWGAHHFPVPLCGTNLGTKHTMGNSLPIGSECHYTTVPGWASHFTEVLKW